jgi:hypothetical protein
VEGLRRGGNVLSCSGDRKRFMSSFCKYLFLLLALVGCWRVSAQRRYIPMDWGNPTPPQRGYAVMCDGDTARGLIKVNVGTSTFPLLDTVTRGSRLLGYPFVVRLRVFSGGADAADAIYTDYVNLHYKHKLWRLIASRGDVALYDDFDRQGLPHVLLVSRGKKIKAYTAMGWLVHDGNGSDEWNMRAMLRFIRRRYQVRLREGDFGSLGALYQFILIKETERNTAAAGMQLH